jgi:hypothetical protein
METEIQGVVSVPGIDLVYYYNQIITFLTNHSGDFLGIIKSIVGVVVGISVPLSIFLLIAIVIVVEGLKRIRNIEDERFNTPTEPSYNDATSKVDQDLAIRWRQVVEHADSTNPNDWKQAIIDADIMLDNLVTRLGYRGESLGEKLKRTTKGDFKTRDQAWEAHLVRNRIAHDGSEFDLNQLEAKRVITLYRQVFEEFYHIEG